MPVGETETSSAAAQALAAYTKGMRNLGRGLIALGCFQAFITILLLVMLAHVVVAVVLVLGLIAACNIGLGMLARRFHAWVNYVVAGCAILFLFLYLAVLGSSPTHLHLAVNPGTCLGIVLAVALLYYSLDNIQKLRRAKAAGARV